MSKFTLIAQQAKKALPLLRAVSASWLGYEAYHSGAHYIEAETKITPMIEGKKDTQKSTTTYNVKLTDSNDLPKNLTRAAFGAGLGCALPMLPVFYCTYRVGTWAFLEPTVYKESK